MESSARASEIDAFMHFLRNEWPAISASVADRLAPRCQKCLLSSKAAKLVDGTCEHCHSYSDDPAEAGEANLEAMRRQIDDLLSAAQGAGSKQHDALLLFSGGKDSAYLLHRLQSDYPKLRLLAVTVDNGFFSSVAMDNALRILDRIPVDHMVVRPAAGLFRKTFRHAFLNTRSGGCYATVDRMDGDLAFDIGRNLAADHNIPLMIAGLSPAQVERILGLTSFESPREQECSNRTESAGFRLSDIYNASEMRHWWNGADRPAEQIPRVIYPFHAWRYDEQFVCEEVIRLGLIEPKKDNPLATNNHTIPLMLAVDVCRLGYSSFEPEFAELVRSGKADRNAWLAMFQALEYLAKEGRFLPDCLSDTLHRLELSHADLGLPRSGREDRPATPTLIGENSAKVSVLSNAAN